MSRFFIDRPVFAWVIAIIIMLAGTIAIFKLPVEQYPNIAPPAVSVRASLPGASAETLENSVTQVIEQKLTGIDNLRYFNSSSDSTGNVSITLTFEPGTDPNIAQVQTQNKVQAALPLLPQEVQQQGITVIKANESFLLVVGFYSEDGKTSQEELGDILSSKIQDSISRVNGVGTATVFGAPHSMRIWLNPDKLFSYNLTASEVRNSITEQNVDVSAGQIGGMPAVTGQQLNATITASSRLRTPQEFEQIVLKVNSNGSQVRLKDVAKIELGSQSYERIVRYKRMPAAGIAVSLASGANALKTAAEVKEKITELTKFLPAGVKVLYPYDTTPFVKLSIKEVVITLVIAIFLVFLVMYLFLQNFRATLIPTIAVPVVLLGTFGALAAFGFSINVLTMFALVLAIGLLVDDAIVVVENVERLMSEEGLSPIEATRKSMDQITGALVGIALVLSAVFVPMAFFGGAPGAIYRQFSLTIVSAMTLSVLVALILSPSLCATILKPVKRGHGEIETGFFGWFNRNFRKSRHLYENVTSSIINRSKRFFVIYAILLAGMIFLFTRIPTSFLPNEDQGVMYLMISSPAGATAETTLESVKQIEDHLLNNEAKNIDHLFTVTGFSFAGSGQNAALGFVGLKDWEERKGQDQSVFALAGRSMGAFSRIKGSSAFAFYPPPIRELGNASGFDFQLVDRGGLGHDALMNARNQLLGMAAQNKNLFAVRPNGLSDVAQYKIDIDSEKAKALGVSVEDINKTLQIVWGSQYVNDFIDEGRIKRVYLQGDAPYRMLPQDVNKWYVKNNKGKMVPFDSFSSARWTYGSPKLERFNGSPSVNIQGSPAPGQSTGTAIAEMEKMAEKLPRGIGYEWQGLSYEERLSGAQTPLLYTLSLIVVFLSLAALYESWSIPFSVMMVVPLGIIGTALAALMTGIGNDIYFQVGLLTTIGLSAKNAILIVEFARNLRRQGHDAKEAAMIAVKQRFRPIIMTSMAFILGVLPLAIAHGAGSASQNAIGIGVMGGMIAASTLAIFFVPMFYLEVQKFSLKKFDKIPDNTETKN
ncbi:MAG: efflux transporter permease subunit [Rickettsiaceae bacterium]|jgi:hydrophobe/amphiphile efflux-1 (HAE1) family protein|nr:efflux transporter permease subunit [Rickettsiaceae bacterium]